MQITELISKQLSSVIPPNRKLVIYGTGDISRIFSDVLVPKIGREIAYYVTTYENGKFGRYNVISIDRVDISDLRQHTVVICSSYYPEIERNLRIFNVANCINVFHYLNVQKTYKYFAPYMSSKDKLRKDFPFQVEWNNDIDIQENIDMVLDVFSTDKEKCLYKSLLSYRLDEDYKLESIAEFVLDNIDIEDVSKQYTLYGDFSCVKTVLDCGASSNVSGFYFSEEMENLEEIHAFEPMPELHASGNYSQLILEKGIRLHNRTYGTWEFSGTAKMHGCSEQEAGGSSLKLQHESQSAGLKQISVISIDDYVDREGIRVDFIKMDVEGAELPSLRGAIKSITRDRPILAISIYHSLNDMIEIPLYLIKNLENYTFQIGHHTLGFSETVLYCTPR